MQRKFKKSLKKAFSENTLTCESALREDEKIEKVTALAKAEWHMREKRTRIGFIALMFRQLRFIGWKMWAMQTAAVLLIAPVIARFFWVKDYFTARRALFLLGIVAVMIAMMMIPFLYRSAGYRMMETESATYFAGRRLLLCRLLPLMAGDIAVIIGVAVAMKTHTALDMKNLLACQFAPFFLCCDGILYLLRKTELSRLWVRYGALGLVILCGICLLYRLEIPYNGDAFLIGLSVLGAGLLTFGFYQGYLLVREPEGSIYA